MLMPCVGRSDILTQFVMSGNDMLCVCVCVYDVDVRHSTQNTRYVQLILHVYCVVVLYCVLLLLVTWQIYRT